MIIDEIIKNTIEKLGDNKQTTKDLATKVLDTCEAISGVQKICDNLQYGFKSKLAKTRETV